ncbi:hypothetical protein MKX03_000178, partial [Papaver bracteatum]
MPQVQMKEPKEKHVVSRKPLQNSLNNHQQQQQQRQPSSSSSDSSPSSSSKNCLQENKKKSTTSVGRRRRKKCRGKMNSTTIDHHDVLLHHHHQVETMKQQTDLSMISSSIPVSSKGLMFQRRPGFGQLGTKCIVKANHFLIELSDNTDLIHYD